MATKREGAVLTSMSLLDLTVDPAGGQRAGQRSRTSLVGEVAQPCLPLDGGAERGSLLGVGVQQVLDHVGEIAALGQRPPDQHAGLLVGEAR